MLPLLNLLGDPLGHYEVVLEGETQGHYETELGQTAPL